MADAFRWYKRNFIIADTSTGVIVSLAIIAALWLPIADASFDAYNHEIRHSIYKTIAAIAGALTGLTITATALILNIWENKSLALIAQHAERSREVSAVLRWTMMSMASTMIVSLVAMSIDIGETPCRIIASATILATIISLVRLCETIWLVQSIAGVITKSLNAPYEL